MLSSLSLALSLLPVTHGTSADLASRSDVFDFAASPPLLGAVRGNLSQILFVLGSQDRDCSLCTTRKVGRLLLCCLTGSGVAHLKCAGLRQPPDSERHCASRPSAVTAPLDAADPVAPSLASAAVAPASPLSGVAPAPVSPPAGVAPAAASVPLVLPVQYRALPPAPSRRPPRLRGLAPAAFQVAVAAPALPVGLTIRATPMLQKRAMMIAGLVYGRTSNMMTNCVPKLV
jgi:hypothetical protein